MKSILTAYLAMLLAALKEKLDCKRSNTGYRKFWANVEKGIHMPPKKLLSYSFII